MANRALFIDLITTRECRDGHIKEFTNIPLDPIKALTIALQKLNKPVIVCRRFGKRSA
jgi:rhodanese-related sulfurtransferase